jgi:membrane protease YdiL (CAAX protease family)
MRMNTIEKKRALIDAVLVVVIAWIVLGIANFGLWSQYLAKASQHDLLLGTLLLAIGFAVGIGVLVIFVLWRLKAGGERTADLGWARPTGKGALIAAVVFGLIWTALSYSRGGNPLEWSWERPLTMAIGLFLAYGEELSMRGFLMTRLKQSGVPTWAQVTITAVVSGSYHGLIGTHYSVTYALSSAFLFAVLALLYIWGRRSLTPSTTAHAMVHFLSDPTLTMGILRGVLAYG